MKPIQLEILEEGRDYTRVECHKPVYPYRYRILRDLCLRIEGMPQISHPITIRNKSGKVYAVVFQDEILVKAGYEWNGCSPKVQIFCRYFGTPDFKKTREASLWHDIGCQCVGQGNLTPSRKDWDQLFLNICLERKFKLARIYYAGTRVGAVL